MNANILLKNSAFFPSTSLMLSINVRNPPKSQNNLKEADIETVHKKK